jgi:hypothetical protein
VLSRVLQDAFIQDDFVQPGHQTQRICDAADSDFVLQLIQTLWNTKPLISSSGLHVLHDGDLVDQAVKERGQSVHFLQI